MLFVDVSLEERFIAPQNSCADAEGALLRESGIKRSLYYGSDRLCLVLAKDGSFPDEWERITVNLPEYPLADNEVFLDVNNFPDAEELIESCGLGYYSGESCRSGFVLYPKYVLDEEKLSALPELEY